MVNLTKLLTTENVNLNRSKMSNLRLLSYYLATTLVDRGMCVLLKQTLKYSGDVFCSMRCLIH